MTTFRHPLRFVVLAFGITWVMWVGALLAARANAIGSSTVNTLYALGGVGPSAAALMIAWRDGGAAGFMSLAKRVLEWRAPLGWYLFAIGLPPALRAIALVLHRVTGGELLPVSAAPAAVVIAFAVALVVPLMEEYGWRGYLQPALLERVTPLAVGVIWGAWHLPLFWFTGTGFARMADALSFFGGIGLYVFSTVALALLFSVMFMKTRGNLLLAFLMHDAVNTSSDVLFAPYVRAGNLRRFGCFLSCLG